MTLARAAASRAGPCPGTTVIAYVEDGWLVLERRQHLLNRVQAHVLDAAARDTASAVDELLADRRTEAASDDPRA